jgi:predicted Zn-dependent protease
MQMTLRLALFLAILVPLAGCVEPLAPQPPVRPGAASAPVPSTTAQRNFASVVQRMEPQIEAECRARTRATNCDYLIVVDDRPGQPPNAFQTVGSNGQPIIGFTLALIGEARNIDELAFVMGHEAAHHIAAHIPRQNQNALAGALIMGALAAATGAEASAVRSAQELGANVALRAYSKDYELEADRLGTILAWNAGYDPERGALFFSRLPDPRNSFLSTHPANAQRLDLVRQTVADLRAGRL